MCSLRTLGWLLFKAVMWFTLCQTCKTVYVEHGLDALVFYVVRAQDFVLFARCTVNDPPIHPLLYY